MYVSVNNIWALNFQFSALANELMLRNLEATYDILSRLSPQATTANPMPHPMAVLPPNSLAMPLITPGTTLVRGALPHHSHMDNNLPHGDITQVGGLGEIQASGNWPNMRWQTCMYHHSNCCVRNVEWV